MNFNMTMEMLGFIQGFMINLMQQHQYEYPVGISISCMMKLLFFIGDLLYSHRKGLDISFETGRS